ncbi:MAG: DUF1573 domain-containing protein [Thermoguttaceae bacterium]|nr:DUF1573 domain-containing protein [Thermoguttaceae bacterium]
MKKTVYAALGGILIGAVLGIVLAYTGMAGRSWSVSVENPDYWESRRQAAQTAAEEALAGKIKAPRVETPEIEYDFGVKEKNRETVTGSHDFPVQNTGTAPLTLKEKTKSCYCTEFHIAKKTLQPGESTTVNVKWDAERGGGSFKQSVIISTNDPVRPEIFFNVKGLFSSPVVAHPNQLLFSGISNGEEQSREFHILGFGTDADGNPLPLSIEDGDVTVWDPDHFRVTLTAAAPDEMTEEEKTNPVLGKATSLIRGTLTVLPGLAQGAFQETVRFKTHRPEQPLLELMVEGQIVGSVSISGTKYDKRKTGQLAIGPVSSARGQTESFRLTFDNPAFIANEETVRLVSTRPDWLHVSFQFLDPEAQKSMPVKWVDAAVEIPAGSPQQRFSGPGLAETGEIVMEIGSDPEKEQVVLPVSFTVGP